MIGAVGFASKRRLELDADDAQFLEAIAAQCAIALSRAEADEQTHRARQAEAAHRLRMEKLLTYAERLQAATAAFSRSLTASDIADVVMTTGLRSLGAVTGAIARLGSGGRAGDRRVGLAEPGCGATSHPQSGRRTDRVCGGRPAAACGRGSQFARMGAAIPGGRRGRQDRQGSRPVWPCPSFTKRRSEAV